MGESIEHLKWHLDSQSSETQVKLDFTWEISLEKLYCKKPVLMRAAVEKKWSPKQ